MISRLIHLIEDHCEAITNRVVKQFREDSRLRHIASLPDSELRDRAQEILKNMGDWITASGAEDTTKFERLGAKRCGQGVPLPELVLSYVMIKDRAIEYSRSEGFANALELWAEEELEHKIGHFFDVLIYHLICGYMAALEGRAPKVAGGRA